MITQQGILHTCNNIQKTFLQRNQFVFDKTKIIFQNFNTEKFLIETFFLFLLCVISELCEHRAGISRRFFLSFFFLSLSSSSVLPSSEVKNNPLLLAVGVKSGEKTCPEETLATNHILQIQFQDGKTTVPNGRSLVSCFRFRLFSPVYC